MLLDFPSPVLTVAPDALRLLDGDQALSSLWYLFTKSKEGLVDGRRLENISWRLWHREHLSTHTYRPLTPNSPSHETNDGSFIESKACLSSRQPTGQVIYEMLLGSSPKKAQTLNSKFRIRRDKKEHTTTHLPTPAAEVVSISLLPQDPQPLFNQHFPKPIASSIPSISTSGSAPSSSSTPTSPQRGSGGGGGGGLVGSSSSNRNHPGAMTLFPRVVVVNPTPNPTPHPTPPATPIPVSLSVEFPVAVSVSTIDPSKNHVVSGTLLLPPVQLLQPTSASGSSSTSSSNQSSANYRASHLQSRPKDSSSATSSHDHLHSHSPSSSASSQRKASQHRSNPGTGTSSAPTRAAICQGSVSPPPPPSSSSAPPTPGTAHSNAGNVIPQSLLPPSPDPSSSSVSSFQHSSSPTTRSEELLSGATAHRHSGFNGSGKADLSPLPHASTNVRSIVGDETRIPSTKMGETNIPAVPTSKFFLPSTTTSPSPGTNGSGGQSSFNSSSGQSFDRRSDASRSDLMSVSPLGNESSNEQTAERSHASSSKLNSSSASAKSPKDTRAVSSSSPSSSTHSRTTKRTAHTQSTKRNTSSNHHTLHSSHHHSPYIGHYQVHGDNAGRGRGRRVGSSSSRSRSRSQNKVYDGLVMTSTTEDTVSHPTSGVNGAGGAKPRPRRKGSGDAARSSGASAVGDRGRLSQPYGYQIYQPHTQTRIQNAGSLNQNEKPDPVASQAQQSKRMFRVGSNVDEDEEGWEDDDDDSSMSRSISKSRSRSRSSRSPTTTTSPAHKADEIRQESNLGNSHQTKVQEKQATVDQQRRPPLSPTQSQSQQQSQQAPLKDTSQGVALGTALVDNKEQRHQQKGRGVVGPTGRPVVISDYDDDDDDEDDDDWEEDEEDESVTRSSSKSHNGDGKGHSANTTRPKPSVDSAADDEDDAGWTSVSDNEANKVPEADATVKTNDTVTTNTTGMTKTTAPVTETTTNTVATNGSWSDKSEGKQKQQQQPQPKVQQYPNPPAPQVLQRAHSSKFVGATGLGFTQLPPQQQQHHQQRQNPNLPTDAKAHSRGQPPHGRRHNAQLSQQIRSNSIAQLSQAAAEVQRQRDLFAKKPKRSYSGIARTGSGLLSQLMNPDPEIFPTNHPYRRGYSSGDVAMPKGGVARLGIAPLSPVTVDNSEPSGGNQRHGEVKKSGISVAAPSVTKHQMPMAPGLKMSKSAVALPVADAVTAASMRDREMAGDRTKPEPPSSRRMSSGYRPKARPENQEMEDTDTEEEDHALEMSSVAQQKLTMLAGKFAAQKQQRQQQRQEVDPPRPEMPGRAVTDAPIGPVVPAPSLIQRTQSQPAPIPLGYPYYLPLAAPPSSPRTTRRVMLEGEMSESLRCNLLWSRQLNRAENLGPVRRNSGSNGTNPPDNKPETRHQVNVSAVPNVVHLRPKNRPGRGVMVDAAGNGEPSMRDSKWTGAKPPNVRRQSSGVVPTTSTMTVDTDDDGDIHVGGGGNVITRTRSWAGLAGGGGMTRLL